MSLLGALLDREIRQPASCLIELGPDAQDLGALAPLVTLVEITASRIEATTGSIVVEDRRKEDGQWLAADSGLFSRWLPIKVSADFQTRIEEIFRGYITRITPSYPNNAGQSALELELQDEGAALDREHLRTVWGEDAPIADRDILDALIAPLGLSRHVESGRGQSSRALAQDATPIQFLRERAEANGYELIFARGEVYFGPRRLEGEAQAPIMVFAGRATNCLTFEIGDDALWPDQVRFDHAPQDQGTTPIVATLAPDLPVLGDTPAASEGADLGTPSVWRITKWGDETEDELRARAQALVNDASFKIRGYGELDGSLYGHVLEVGRTVTVDGAGGRYGGLYYVEQVVHRFTPEGYRQTFELSRNGTGETAGATGPISAAASAIAGLF
jgi:hypothetical protein